jgi:exodeoxyribonuclease VII large subunit
LEDLWAFNDERLARTIAACPVPVVSGVGHEIDFTIADFVADVRAPTPSAAAELVTPNRLELERLLDDTQLTLNDLLQRHITAARSQVQGQQWALARFSPQNRINNARQQVDGLLGHLQQSVRHRLILQQERVTTLQARLETLNPQATLQRGYAIVQKGDTAITQAGQVSAGERLVVKVSEGEFGVRVE